MIYVRSFHNANPFTVRLFYRLQKAGIKIAMEIPTYPYDSEYKGFPFFTRCGLQIDRLFRKTFGKASQRYCHIFRRKNDIRPTHCQDIQRGGFRYCSTPKDNKQ